MTGVQLALDDCDPAWPDDTPRLPAERTPPAGLLRLQELRDLEDQGASPRALRCATTVPTGRYL